MTKQNFVNFSFIIFKKIYFKNHFLLAVNLKVTQRYIDKEINLNFYKFVLKYFDI